VRDPRRVWPLALLLALGVAPQPPLPYRDATLPVAERVRDLLGRMTLEEKFWQVFMIPGDLDNPANDYSKGIFGLQISTAPAGAGTATARAHAERINAIQRYFVEKTRLGIPIIPFDEAVHGLARDGATMFPQAIALAATWDPSLVSRVAAAVARETGSRGIRQVLAGRQHRRRRAVGKGGGDLRRGSVSRVGDGPCLRRGLRRAGIVTTPKHFVANVGEGGRDSYPIDHGERLLRERYLPPFEAAILDGHARSIMTAYNSVDGSPATQNRRLLTDWLKGEWRFEGFAISDAAATGGATVLHMTEPDTPTAAKDAYEAGLDVVFQSSYGQQRPPEPSSAD
jgi:beta-glucosidase